MMDSSPLISVVIPSLDQGNFIEQAIRSVLDQEHSNVELIVIDGGSKDNSVEIIKSYGKKLHYWVSEPDTGQSHAINKGMEQASGELVAWLNADDYYVNNALGKVAEAYRANSNASFYFGDGLRVDKAGIEISRFFPQKPYFSYVALFYGLNAILQPATFIPKDCWRHVGGLDSGLRYGMDSDLWIKLAMVCPPRSIDAVLAASREYERTKTSLGGFERVEELRRIAERYTGEPFTPGIFCYYLDTIRNYLTAEAGSDWYASGVLPAVDNLWMQVSKTLARIAGSTDGIPTSEISKSEEEEIGRLLVGGENQARGTSRDELVVNVIRAMAAGRAIDKWPGKESMQEDGYEKGREKTSIWRKIFGRTDMEAKKR